MSILLINSLSRVQTSITDPRRLRNVRLITTRNAVRVRRRPLDTLHHGPRTSVGMTVSLIGRGQTSTIISTNRSKTTVTSTLLHLNQLGNVSQPTVKTIFPAIVTGGSILVLSMKTGMSYQPGCLRRFTVVNAVCSHCILKIRRPGINLVGVNRRPDGNSRLSLRTRRLLRRGPGVPFTNGTRKHSVLSNRFSIIIYSNFINGILLGFTRTMNRSILRVLQRRLPRNVHNGVNATVLGPGLQQVGRQMSRTRRNNKLLLNITKMAIVDRNDSRTPSIFGTIQLTGRTISGHILSQVRTRCRQITVPTTSKR